MKINLFKMVKRYKNGRWYKRWFAQFYPQNILWFKDYVFSKEEKESEHERFIRILNKYDDIADAFYRWTK